MTDRIIVQFEGAGSGVAELSLRQAGIWSVMHGEDDEDDEAPPGDETPGQPPVGGTWVPAPIGVVR